MSIDLTNIGKNLSGGIHAPGLPPGATLILISDPPNFPYLPVRRLAVYIEQSLTASLQWVVFEPNGPPLWTAIANAVDNFMQELFLQGHFQGTAPQTAYFVKCDATTTTQTDIDNGVVNIIVGFAPVKPAEFYVLTLRLHTNEPAPPKK